jgi:hypothetical protein
MFAATQNLRVLGAGTNIARGMQQALRMLKHQQSPCAT